MATFIHVGADSLNSGDTPVYTSTSDSTIVLSILCVNESGSDTQVTWNHLNSDDSVKNKVAQSIVIPAQASLELLANKYVLPNGEKFQVNSNVASSLSYSLSMVDVA